MKRYGILGGTFNPIHSAHIYIAYEAKEQLNLDGVIFMPAGNPPHKRDSKIIDAEYRYNMVKEAIQSYESFIISDYEIKREGFSYTYKTLQEINNDDIELFFISGADSLMDIEKWRHPEIILDNCKFVVFNRGDVSKDILEEQRNNLLSKYNAEIILLDVVNIDISSSMIRQRIKEGKRVDFFLPKEVLAYIEKNGLYRGD